MASQKIIIGITGASGAIYGVRLLEALKSCNLETHVICSSNGEKTLKIETGLSIDYIKALATVSHDSSNMAAVVSSGSFKSLGMIVAPCSMRTLAEIANGVTTSLVSRAADVILKERRRLVLMTRESPLNAIHLKNMLAVTNCGGIIAPPLPCFYNKPIDINDIVNNSIGRILDLFNLKNPFVKRWQGAS